MLIQYVCVYSLPIRQIDDIEMNPVTRPNPCHSFSIHH